jgi:hypothetical protein
MTALATWLPPELAALPRYLIALAIGLLMGLERVQLVLPRGFHASYTPAQQGWLMEVAGFVALAWGRQTARSA